MSEHEPAPVDEPARLYEQLDFGRTAPPAPAPLVAAESSVTRAVALGTGAAVLGALVYFGVRALTGYELGLIAIGVGIAVGLAVRTGAAGSRHRGFRFLALGLAYVSIAVTYVPALIQAAEGARVGVGLLISAALIALAVPFMMLAHGEIMSVVILGIALWEAWRFSAPQAPLAKPAAPLP